jgi:L-threonylcarbamoyladenylate synthase
VIEAAAAAISRGEVVGLPTDTVYGIGVDPLNPDAVERLFELKGRPPHKPVGVLASSYEQAASIALLDGEAAELAAGHWPGPLTVVVTPKIIMADWVGDRQLRTLGIRVPDHPVALALLSVTGPLAVTSANHAGGPETMSDEEARALFGDSVSVYLSGIAPGGQASTVVDCTGPRLVVLRKGPVEI